METIKKYAHDYRDMAMSEEMLTEMLAKYTEELLAEYLEKLKHYHD